MQKQKPGKGGLRFSSSSPSGVDGGAVSIGNFSHLALADSSPLSRFNRCTTSHEQQARAVMIQEQGSFAVGGSVITAPGTFDPIKQGAGHSRHPLTKRRSAHNRD